MRPKPKEILELEMVYGIQLSELKSGHYRDNENQNKYKLNKDGKVIYLNLRDNQIKEISNLHVLEYLTWLDLGENNITTIGFLDQMVNLTSLYLDNNKVKKIENLDKLVKLKVLYLSDNEIKKIENLEKFMKLTLLDLSCNQIKKIENLDKLAKLKVLDLSENEIKKIENLDKLVNLVDLSLRSNELTKIENLDKLVNLVDLDLDFNNITTIENLDNLVTLKSLSLSENKISNGIEQLLKNKESLTSLRIHQNPFLLKINLKLNYDGTNHLAPVMNYLIRKYEQNKIKVTLPVKVLFLGNHYSGKSTFAYYFIHSRRGRFEINNKIESTHILSIKQFKKELNNYNLPQAIIFDFGGHDYYHGIYQAFMTNDSINCIFWQKETDHNMLDIIRSKMEKTATEKQDNNSMTYYFDRKYWLHQLIYFYEEIRQSDKMSSQPVFLIQTYADKDDRLNTLENYKQLHIENEFFVALTPDALKISSKKNALNYLESSLSEKITDKRKVIEEPMWYIDFLKYILHYSDYNSVDLEEIRKHYKRKTDKDYLPDDLDQLCKQGLILYYPYNEELKNIAWLNPELTVKNIYQKVLSNDSLRKNKGKIKKRNFDKISDKKITALLLVNKVIFFDKTDIKNPLYIIPGFLPAFRQSNEEFFIISGFENPHILLKFENFIPFGLINQLICHYGTAPDKKLYWRDQLVFTYFERKAKVRIYLDFENLEIQITIKNLLAESNILDIERSILDDIIALYWNENPKVYQDKESEHFEGEILENDGKFRKSKMAIIEKAKQRKSISDLYISVDNRLFINLQLLDDQNNDIDELVFYPIKENSKEIKVRNNEIECEKELKYRIIDKTKPRSGNVLDYRHLSTNTKLNFMKKVFISYSNKDYGFLEKLKTHLSPFGALNIIDTWDCTELQPGNWHEQIQKKLEEADIVLFMMSANFLASNYILQKELLPSFKRIRFDKNKKLFFVIVKNFAYNSLVKYSDLTGEIDLSNPENVLLELTKHQFIPYQINDNNERKLTPINKWEDENDAYVEIVEQLLKTIEI